MKSPAKGAATSIHLASDPALAQVTDGYFINSKPKRSAKPSYDAAVASRLWQASSDLVGLGHRAPSKQADDNFPVADGGGRPKSGRGLAPE